MVTMDRNNDFFASDIVLYIVNGFLREKKSSLRKLITTKEFDPESHKLSVTITRAEIEMLHQEKEKIWFPKLLQGMNRIKIILEKSGSPSCEDIHLMRRIVNFLKETGEPFDEPTNQLMASISKRISVLSPSLQDS